MTRIEMVRGERAEVIRKRAEPVMAYMMSMTPDDAFSMLAYATVQGMFTAVSRDGISRKEALEEYIKGIRDTFDANEKALGSM